MSRSRRWAFTLFGFNDTDIENLKKLDYSYIIFGKEICPKTTKEHLQGYVEFKNAKNMSAIKKLVKNDKIHLETAYKCGTANTRYCSKESVLFEDGEAKGVQGKRTDIMIAKEIMYNTGSIPEVLNNTNSYPAFQYAERMMKYLPLSLEYRKKNVLWFWGTTGTGKTREAYEIAKKLGGGFWRTSQSTWFDGYFGQEVVLFDDLRAMNFQFTWLLQLLDGYEINVPIKGSFGRWRPETIIITTNRTPEKMYKGREDEELDQLIRRISEIRYFGEASESVILKRLLRGEGEGGLITFDD